MNCIHYAVALHISTATFDGKVCLGVDFRTPILQVIGQKSIRLHWGYAPSEIRDCFHQLPFINLEAWGRSSLFTWPIRITLACRHKYSSHWSVAALTNGRTVIYSLPGPDEKATASLAFCYRASLLFVNAGCW